MFCRTISRRERVIRTRSPCVSDHCTAKSSSVAAASASRASRTLRSNSATSFSVGS